MKTVIEMAREVAGDDWTLFRDFMPEIHRLADLVRADEREQIAQMIENAPGLVEFAQNDQGGCAICGFTPRLAAAAIRARSNK